MDIICQHFEDYLGDPAVTSKDACLYDFTKVYFLSDVNALTIHRKFYQSAKRTHVMRSKYKIIRDYLVKKYFFKHQQKVSINGSN